MRSLWTVAEVVAATGGRPEGLLDGPIASISVDAGGIAPEALFIALKSDRQDGHDFVGKALDAGAAAALVSEAFHARNGGNKLIVVADPHAALTQLAVASRARSKAQIIAVTGSAGRTTTVQAIGAALAEAGETLSAAKDASVQLSLARLPREAQFGVFGLGASRPGAVAPLATLVRPHIAVITTIAAAQLQFFPSIADIAAANAEIFAGLEPGGTVLLNADHDYLHILFGKAREAKVGRVVTYGFDDSADWHIERLGTLGARITATVRHGERIHMLNLSLQGRHMVANAVAALAASDLSGEGVNGATAALAKFTLPEGKGETERLGPHERPLLLIDESDNANLASMAAALEVYAGVKSAGGKKALVLGDMQELGPQGAALHASLKDAALNTGADKIFLVGTAIEALNSALGEGYVSGHARQIEDLSVVILSSLAHGDAVMVKGSNGVRLGTLVAKIRETFA